MQRTESILPAIYTRITEIEQSLSVKTSGRAICRLQKDGIATHGIKYDEGRYAALRKCRRLLSSDPEAEMSPAILAQLQREAEEWQRMLQIYQHKPEKPIQWIAYTQGGVDAMMEVQTLLEA